MRDRRIATLLVVLLCLSLGVVRAAEPPRDLMREIMNTAGLRGGGAIVFLGGADGRLPEILRPADEFIVQILDPDPTKVEKVREALHERGVYGAVSAQTLESRQLPYADNLINLVVIFEPDLVPMKEILRVLVPNGVVSARDGNGGWQKTIKPRPDNIDEWTHFLHDAGNNAVADDEVVDTPRALQWVDDPLWLRSHETPSGVQAQVASGGRLFYIFDEGLVGITDERLPDRWSIVCRDAFNGKELWKRAVTPWGWREWAKEKWEGQDWTVVRAGRTAVPDENQCRLVADGDRLYATLGFEAPLSILDAATGEILKTIDETQGAYRLLASDGVVVAYIRSGPTPNEKRRGDGAAKTDISKIVAVRGETGKVLWSQTTGGIRPMIFGVDQGRVFYQAGADIICLGLADGEEIWRDALKVKNATTLVANKGLVFVKSGAMLAAYDGAKGKPLWNKKVMNDSGAASVDLFVANGFVWTGMTAVDENKKPGRKVASALAVGLDPMTGDEKKRIFAADLRSPEHHHRCYRNKATNRFMISAMEGAEFMDLREDGHSQNNWIRGACKLGVMPCNGLLYVPSDQCFCEPGAKLLGYAAIGPEPAERRPEIADEKRLMKGPVYEQFVGYKNKKNALDWPTYRHDPARSGSTDSKVSASVAQAWSTKIGGKLTAPVMAYGMVFVAATDAHTIHALDAKTGERKWRFTADGRIDSPPTIHQDMAIFGSADGRVYCLRASDGALIWRFTAAPSERGIGAFGQIESAWPVHGSVLVSENVAYFTAGRSSYLDGGIRAYGLRPTTGEILYKGSIEGPHPTLKDGQRDYSFYITGANSDVLVAQNDQIYMRQKTLTRDLKNVEPKLLSNKGEHNTGLHIFSTSGLLDGSGYNRAFWMYSKRWPGFQLANQAPKAGQLLVVGEKQTYAVRTFYRRNVHSPMFFPGKEGYLIFADNNDNEPQIVGEEGARKPLEWLPQSDYSAGNEKNKRKLDSEAFGLDKMIGYTRAEPTVWAEWLKIRVRAMVKAGDALFVAGPPDVYDEKDPYAAFEARGGACLAALSASSGEKLTEIPLDSPPVFDGMIAAQGRLYLSLRDGRIVCMAEKK